MPFRVFVALVHHWMPARHSLELLDVFGEELWLVSVSSLVAGMYQASERVVRTCRPT